jgi:hypothetical protein
MVVAALQAVGVTAASLSVGCTPRRIHREVQVASASGHQPLPTFVAALVAATGGQARVRFL